MAIVGTLSVGTLWGARDYDSQISGQRVGVYRILLVQEGFYYNCHLGDYYLLSVWNHL